MQYTKDKNGFALLLTLIVVSVVLAIGLSLLNITLKQFTLSSTARDSESAFHAASTGLECMQYHRSVPATRDNLLNGGNIPTLRCGDDEAPVSWNTNPNYYVNHSAGLYMYQYKYSYDLPSGQCVETSMYLMDIRNGTRDLTRGLPNEGLETITCQQGALCTTIFSRGYNRACDSLDSIRTVQRELTIQF